MPYPEWNAVGEAKNSGRNREKGQYQRYLGFVRAGIVFLQGPADWAQCCPPRFWVAGFFRLEKHPGGVCGSQ